MKRRLWHESGRPASDLLEESVRLLRAAPMSTWLCYYVGTIPCMLGGLYFVADMSRSADAHHRLVGSSIGMTVIWLWMKCWQAVFAYRLRSETLLLTAPEWSVARVFRLVTAQVTLQPIGLILRPLALLTVLSFVWIDTFFQNVTVLGDGGGDGVGKLFRRAFVQTTRWPLQAYFAFALLAIFGLFVWANLAITLQSLPALANMLLGIESRFSQNSSGLWSPTFVAVTFAGLYLCLDPLRKTINVLRCFYGGSQRTGEDLEVQMKTVRRAPSTATAVVAAVVLFFGAFAPASGRAETPPPPAKVKAEELGQSVDEVLKRREYAWRAPREAVQQVEDTSWFGKVRKDIGEWLERRVQATKTWMKKMRKRFMDWLFPEKKYEEHDGPDFLSFLGNAKVIMIVCLVLAAIALVVVFLRRRVPVVAAHAEPAAPLPDLNAENVTADQLPEDGWLAMARELMERGQYRLSMRASYLAGLAHLGHRELITLAKHKSNRDYDRELQRRARSNIDLLTAFGRNLGAFEAAWYGDHEVTPQSLGDFSENLHRIRSC